VSTIEKVTAMTRSYKGYRIETVVRIESGLWKAWANIVPPIKDTGDLSRGGYATREEGESAVWEIAKEKIDRVTN
jgi:hypothetical protein